MAIRVSLGIKAAAATFCGSTAPSAICCNAATKQHGRSEKIGMTTHRWSGHRSSGASGFAGAAFAAVGSRVTFDRFG